jgi:anti-sigma regulatory factor (Ser/Thr protein kinase)
MIAAAISRRSGVPSDLLDEIKLAVGEACARAVTVNSRFDPDALVEIQFTMDDGTFRVSVADRGPDGTDVPPRADGGHVAAPDLLEAAALRTAGALPEPGTGDPDLGDDLPAGLGLALIEGLVDDVVIAPRPDSAGTIVTMCWHTEKLDELPLVL